MGVVLSGVSVSAAVGVPLGTWVGQALGWRGSFVGVVVLGVLALIAILALVPSVPSTGGAAGQARYAFAPRVLAVLGLNFLTFAAIFAAVTYIVPFLQHITGISGPLISVFLLVYGNSYSSGHLRRRPVRRPKRRAHPARRHHRCRSIPAGPQPRRRSRRPLVALALAALGLFAMGMTPSIQYRVVSLAGPGGALASSLPASAINVGIAFGSTAGGLAISTFTTSSAVIAGLVIAALAVPVAVATRHLKPPTVETAPNQRAAKTSAELTV